VRGLIALPANAQQTLPRPAQTPLPTAQQKSPPPTPQGQKGAAPQQAQQPPMAPPAPYAVLKVAPPKPYTDPSLAAFRKELAAIAQKKDRPALAKLVLAQGFFWLKETGNAAGKKTGIEALSTALSLAAKDGSGWETLGEFAADETAAPYPDRPNTVCAPAGPEFDAAALEKLAEATKTDLGDWGFTAAGLRRTGGFIFGMTRREATKVIAGTAASLLVAPGLPGQEPTGLIQRAIPSSGEMLPVIGLGSSATFSQVARKEDVAALGEVLKALVAGGGTVFDTAPGYGASEQVAGRIVSESGLADRLFWATKVNVARQGPADPAAARAQIDTSFQRVKKSRIDLIQVHNMGDVKTQVPILREQKAQGRIRYIGVTTTFEPQYPQMIETMKAEPLDFIGVDYAIDNREVENTILPLARDRRIGVFVYAPFGRTRLFRRVGDRPVPDWAGEFDAKTWAQFFLKFVLSHPAVTVATPATSQAKNMVDNLAGGVGRLPDEAMRKRMAAFVDALPSA